MQNKKTKQNKKKQQQQQKTKKQTIKTRSKKSVLGATADDLLPFLIKHFPPPKIFCYTQVLINPLCKVSEKSTNYFGSIQQAIERKSCNIYQEKLIMSGTDIILILNINTQN